MLNTTMNMKDGELYAALEGRLDTLSSPGFEKEMEAMYWATNKKWYQINEKSKTIELTRHATPRAIESFRLWLKQNNRPVNI